MTAEGDVRHQRCLAWWVLRGSSNTPTQPMICTPQNQRYECVGNVKLSMPGETLADSIALGTVA